jgi:hypothetical protein
METQCQFLKGCPMFKYFRQYAIKVYTELYCEGDYEKCKRRILRLSGQQVPANLLPHGGKLWEDGKAPPSGWQR